MGSIENFKPEIPQIRDKKGTKSGLFTPKLLAKEASRLGQPFDKPSARMALKDGISL
jgi:hypothetical protein